MLRLIPLARKKKREKAKVEEVLKNVCKEQIMRKRANKSLANMWKSICQAAGWSGVESPACCAECPMFEPGMGSPRIYKIDFHQQKLSSLSIAYDIKLEGSLYSSVLC